MGRFDGDVVIVTGASAGIGLEVSRGLRAEGARIVAVARRPEPLDAVVEELGSEHVLAVPADVADNAALARVAEQARERFGRITGLVNNAGAHVRGPVVDRSADEIATMVDVNLRGPLVLTRLVLDDLREHGGFVVNVARLAGKVPLNGAATYSATKFGLRAFTFALAEELRDTDVRISAVSPGPVETDFILEHLDDVADITFSQDTCTAADVARMVLDCAHDGLRERSWPEGGGRLATLAYLFPAVRRMLEPRLTAKGAARKAAIRERLARGSSDGS